MTTLSKDGVHSAERLTDDTYRIDERGIANCYLLLGDDSALLIDCGVGLGDIRAAAEEITPKPITVALTHRHCDHAGGRNFFERYWVNEGDRGPIYAALSSDLAGRTLLKGAPDAKALKLSPKPCRAKPEYFGDGKVFELGGRTVRTINVPGHTRGSVVFLDDKNKLMFTGDDVNPYLWMQLPGCTTLGVWLTGAKEILKLADGYAAFGGHGDGRIPKEGVEQIVDVVESLLKETPPIKGKTIDYPSPDAPIHVLVTKKKIR